MDFFTHKERRPITNQVGSVSKLWQIRIRNHGFEIRIRNQEAGNLRRGSGHINTEQRNRTRARLCFRYDDSTLTAVHPRRLYAALLSAVLLLADLVPASAGSNRRFGAGPSRRDSLGFAATPDGMVYLFGGGGASGEGSGDGGRGAAEVVWVGGRVAGEGAILVA